MLEPPCVRTGPAEALNRLLSRRPGRLPVNRPLVLGGLILAVFFALAAAVPVAYPYDPTTPRLEASLEGPSPVHPLGTDDLGRDLLARLAHGARFPLLMGVAAMVLAAGIGVPAGLFAGYRGGVWDLVLMRLVDALVSLPSIVLAVALVSVLGAGPGSVIVAVGVTSVPAFARLARTLALSLREQEFVTAARAVGAGEVRILGRHLLPNALPPIVVQASLGLGNTVLAASALGFLGLGVQPPTPEWGAMLSRGRVYVSTAPHLVAFPGLAISLLVLGFNFLGDGLRDLLDPRLKIQTERSSRP
jgi:ABC-type dipeptide/oligopeptide/nickel transport system permease subunit